MTIVPYAKPRTEADVVRESLAHPAINPHFLSHLFNPTASNSSLIYLICQPQQGGGMGMMNPMMVSLMAIAWKGI